MDTKEKQEKRLGGKEEKRTSSPALLPGMSSLGIYDQMIHRTKVSSLPK